MVCALHRTETSCLLLMLVMTPSSSLTPTVRTRVASQRTYVGYHWQQPTGRQRSPTTGQFVTSTGHRRISVVFTNSSVYSGLAIDVGRRKLYFSDSARGEIGELNIAEVAPNPRIVMSDNGSTPTAVTCDTVNGLLYWTNGRQPPAVYVSSAQNGGKTTVITGSFNPLKMLTVDFAGQTMYFGNTMEILSSYIDGRNCTRPDFKDLPTFKPLAMTVDSTYIYIGYSIGIIRKFKRSAPASELYETLDGIFSQPRALSVHISAEQNRTAPNRTYTITSPSSPTTAHTTASSPRTPQTASSSTSTPNANIVDDTRTMLPVQTSSVDQKMDDGSRVRLIAGVVVGVGGLIIIAGVVLTVVIIKRISRPDGRESNVYSHVNYDQPARKCCFN